MQESNVNLQVNTETIDNVLSAHLTNLQAHLSTFRQSFELPSPPDQRGVRRAA